MDPVNRLSRLMETLRQRMAESAKKLGTTSQTSAPSAPRSPASANRRTVEELRAHIGERVRSLEPNNPERRRRARRIFLESVLAWEFGDQLLLDNQFSRLIDGIQEAFESDPEIDRELSDLLTDLSRV